MMPNFHRRSIRLPEYDYAQPGAYFVTVVTHHRAQVLAKVSDGQIRLSPVGKVVEHCWSTLPAHFRVTLDAFVIMPNHIHGIIMILEAGESSHFRRGEASGRVKPFGMTSPSPDASPLPLPINEAVSDKFPHHPNGTIANSLSAAIQNLKSISTRKANILRQSPGTPLWQRNYYEHVIRSERDLDSVRAYILANPCQWDHDPENITSKTVQVVDDSINEISASSALRAPNENCDETM